MHRHPSATLFSWLPNFLREVFTIKPTFIDPARGHRLWADTYDTDLNPLLALEQRIVEPLLGDPRGKWVVDVGCGTGRWTSLAQDAGAKVAGLDLTPEMLAIAAWKLGLAGHLVCADVENVPVRDHLADIVVCSFCISYAGSLRQTFAELARIVRPGGRIIVSDVHPVAIASGWRRTFRSGGQIYEMQIEPRDSELVFAAGAEAGLTLSQTIEPRLGMPEREFFGHAGKLDVFEAVSRPPALMITLWES